MAQIDDIWDFINPELSPQNEELFDPKKHIKPPLIAPIMPSRPQEVTENAMFEWNVALTIYEFEYEVYRTWKRAMINIDTVITTTVDPRYDVFTREGTTHEKLNRLHYFLKRTNLRKEVAIRQEFNRNPLQGLSSGSKRPR